MENEDQIQDLIEEIEGAILKEKELRRGSDDDIVVTFNDMVTKLLTSYSSLKADILKK